MPSPKSSLFLRWVIHYVVPMFLAMLVMVALTPFWLMLVRKRVWG